MDKKFIFVFIMLAVAGVIAYILTKQKQSESLLSQIDKDQVQTVDAGGLKLSDVNMLFANIASGGTAGAATGGTSGSLTNVLGAIIGKK